MKTYLRNLILPLDQDDAFMSSDWYEMVIRKSLTHAFDHNLSNFISEEYASVFMDENFCVKQELESIYNDALQIFAKVASGAGVDNANCLKVQYKKLLELETISRNLKSWQIFKRISLGRQIGDYALVDVKMVMLVLWGGYAKNMNDDPQAFYFFANKVANNWLNSMEANF